jgi:hypothetical protein
MRSAAFSAIGAELAKGIGHGGTNGGPLFGEGNWHITALAHGVAQGTLGWVSNNDFWTGFVSGSASHVVGHYTENLPNVVLRTAIATSTGALLAKATGGDAMQGAVSAMLVHLFNKEPEIKKREEALEAYRDLEEVMRMRARETSGPIKMSMEELAILLEGQYHIVRSEPRLSKLYSDYGPSIAGQLSGGPSDTFLYDGFGARQISIGGDLVWAGHLNYVAVGMMAAHYGTTMYQGLPVMVSLHNLGQVAGYKSVEGATLRHFKDILPGIKWSTIGAHYYRRRSGN